MDQEIARVGPPSLMGTRNGRCLWRARSTAPTQPRGQPSVSRSPSVEIQASSKGQLDSVAAQGQELSKRMDADIKDAQKEYADAFAALKARWQSAGGAAAPAPRQSSAGAGYAAR
jgi:hypothetical protein